jgi:ribosome-associated translation inhibitor RaiA/cold shock CspA family protein
MQVPVDIAFHNLDHQDWAEQEIRARIAKLEKIYDRLITCRVRVEQRSGNGRGAIPPVVRIDLGIPGHSHLVVNHEPDHLLQRYQRPDLRHAINEAFRIAEQQLIELKTKRAGRTKDAHHDGENQHLGQIAELTPDEDFGFLVTMEGGLLYFHRNSVLSGDFERLRRDDEVFYVEAMGDTGPTATKVRAKAER